MSNIQSIKNLPIISVTASIDIVPLSKYSSGAADLAKVQVNLRLQQPLSEEAKFLVPSEDFKSHKVYLPNGDKAEMGDFDPAAAEDIEALKPQIQDKLTAFLEQANADSMNNVVSAMTDYLEYKSWSKVVTIPAGQSYITLEFTKPIVYDANNGEYTLETVVPLPSFSMVNQQGSKASLIVLMPIEIMDSNKILERTWTPPNGAATPLEITSIAGRLALTGYWQYDPVIRIRYIY